ncbi:hypothetical protein PV11_07323 [Exophiala sideris]|uniref:Uncharacterized protein n=1 Tax=Exophiala sideris TaxID=1016849 RepID=A0A0D1Y9X2_9EURO|nr:hypothetical protein PV11_07323 [Exophiala sideris]
MDYIPERLVKGIRQARDAMPSPVAGNNPTSTFTLPNGKVTHAIGKLGQAGVVDDSDGGLGLATTTTSIHAEKITHLTSKLAQAGLSSSDDSSKPSSHGLATKYIIVIAVVGAVVLAALSAGGVLLWRRYRRRRAYNVVSKGVDVKGKGAARDKESDMFNADMAEADGFDPNGHKLGERNFESGYDKVDTGYESTGYKDTPDLGDQGEKSGDKRSNFEA